MQVATWISLSFTTTEFRQECLSTDRINRDLLYTYKKIHPPPKKKKKEKTKKPYASSLPRSWRCLADWAKKSTIAGVNSICISTTSDSAVTLSPISSVGNESWVSSSTLLRTQVFFRWPCLLPAFRLRVPWECLCGLWCWAGWGVWWGACCGVSMFCQVSSQRTQRWW